jgi:hypothetical protein
MRPGIFLESPSNPPGVSCRSCVDKATLDVWGRKDVGRVPADRWRILRLDPMVKDQRSRVSVREPSRTVLVVGIAVPALRLSRCVSHNLRFTIRLPKCHVSFT